MHGQYIFSVLDDTRLESGRCTPAADLRIQPRPARRRESYEIKTVQHRHSIPSGKLNAGRKHQCQPLLNDPHERQLAGFLRRSAKADIEAAAEQSLMLF